MSEHQFKYGDQVRMTAAGLAASIRPLRVKTPNVVGVVTNHPRKLDRVTVQIMGMKGQHIYHTDFWEHVREESP